MPGELPQKIIQFVGYFQSHGVSRTSNGRLLRFPCRSPQAGVALTALASRVIFKETITPVMVLGLCLIVRGVLLIELGATR
ncbi:drug/metabolite transporter (DMT)-like permease [Arthrobacter ulcerisalmonis]|nr:drug/metabolite transporter (DMT)-like permease [Arthrobacter ulcerisalmonis]